MQKINRCMKCMWEKEKGRFCRNCGYDSDSRNPERALPVGTILHNKYMIGAVLGEGGFGITYAAWETLIEAPIAIKEYFPSEAVTRDTTMYDGEFHTDLALIQGEEGEQRFQTGIERFVQEAEKLARFQKQPGVVCVKDFFYENNTAYMVMEYIRGTTLKAYLDSHGDKLSVEETLKMMEPVMRTLEEIHRAGVIHRDISPDNIMVTEDDQIKLIDFGAAKFMDAGDEKSMTLMLKHGYAPEEQYRSDGKQGTWTDVYALSAVMYRMLTGKAPEEITRRMVERPDTVHKELATVPGLPVQVRHGIEKGVAIKADKRYQTVGALYDGLYGRRKMQTGQWVIAGGIVAAAVVCMVFGGMIVRKSQELERNLTEADNIQEEADTQKELVDDDSLPVEGEGEVNEGVVEEELVEEEEVVEETVEEEEVSEEVMKIAERAQNTVLDYAAVYDEGDRCVFAVTEEVMPDDSTAYSVWASYDGKIEEVEIIYSNEIGGYDTGKSQIFRFGRAQHFSIEFSEAESFVQYKYCYEEGKARKTDDSLYFVQSENGRIKVNIAGYPRTGGRYGTSLLKIMNLADVFYYEHQYVEYAAEVADINSLEQYENYNEILLEAEENLMDVVYIDEGQEFADYKVERCELDYIRRAENGTYYLNYKIYGKMKEDSYWIYGNNKEGIVKEPDADGYCENNIWACVVLEVTGNRLEIENQYIGEKQEHSDLELPVYYGSGRELKPASRTKSELGALIEEKSGKNIVGGRWSGCYEDLDGDGAYEMFAFVADSWDAYLDNSPNRSDYVRKEATGCALWFSDGEQTVLVAELKDGYGELSTEALQFGENKQCVLTRLMPDTYYSIDEILTADGYATTVCEFDNGIPHVIIQDENMRFYQKEDSDEIGCYGPYGTWRPDDSVFYRNGSYYWQSDSSPVFE